MKGGLIMKRNVIVNVLLDIAILTLYLMLMFAAAVADIAR